MSHKHSRPCPGGRNVWIVERLWPLVKDLTVRVVRIDTITEFDENCWFKDGESPTCRAVATHVKRIHEADLSHPIILSADGKLMDGGHRIAKAWLLGLTEIKAVQFEIDPEPDEFVRRD